jgi:ribosomal protein L29
MKYQDIAKKSDQELAELVQTEREALREVRFGATGAGARDVKKIRTAKRAIAHALTELSARRRSASSNNE